METNPYTVKYRKADARYYVSLDGVQVGWVCKAHDGWVFYASVNESVRGERLACEPQRGIAVEEGLSLLRIYHGSRVFTLDLDRNSDTFCKDVSVWFDRDRLEATVDRMSTVRYGLA